MIPEDAIRLRSYLIWQQSGCPEGRAIEHWLRAKDELEAEHMASLLRRGNCEQIVVPLVPIRRPPQRSTAARIAADVRRRPSYRCHAISGSSIGMCAAGWYGTTRTV